MNRIEQIENFAKQLLDTEAAHDFEHIHRVRNWTLKIAKGEGYPSDLEVPEAAALLHDIGLPQSKDNRRMHGQAGADIAREYLLENDFFTPAQVEEIVNAIRYHCRNREGEGQLLDILRDADMIDSLGAIGVIRTVRYWPNKPDYDPANIRSAAWGKNAKFFDERFDRGADSGDNIVEFINFQISTYENMATETGKALARPLISFARNFILQLESEVNCTVGV